MKTILNISSPIAKEDPKNLLIELSDFGMSILTYSKKLNKIFGITVNLFEDDDIIEDNVYNVLQNISEPFSFETILFFYSIKSFLLVPQKFYHADLNKEMLSLIHGDQIEAKILVDHIEKEDIFNVYRIDEKLHNAILIGLPNAKFMHTTSVQLQKRGPGSYIIAIVFYNTIKTILYHNDQLVLVQQFSFNSPQDVAYHLLNICQQNELKPAEIELWLSGMITKESNLFQQLHNYFLNISFMSASETYSLDNEMRDIPAHFFSHLSELALCV